MERYKELFKQFKDKVIDKYEDWFADEVLMDISEIGGFDSLIDQQYEFMFNLDLSRSLQSVINSLLYEAYDIQDEKILDEYKRQLIEFIKLKRITDKRIIESKAYNQDWVNDWLFDNKPTENELLPIELNSRLLSQDELIDDLYAYLMENNYIECSNNTFKEHFLEKSTKNKIDWIGKQSEIAAFIQLLYEYDIIPKDKERGKKIKLTSDNFYFKRNNKEFNTKSISKEFSVFKNDETLCPELRNFFKELSKKKKIKFR